MLNEIHATERLVAFSGNMCWCCGKSEMPLEKMTRHHAIPQRLSPLKNVTVPVCRSCHNKVNIIDSPVLVHIVHLVKRYISRVRDVSVDWVDPELEALIEELQ